MQYYDQHLHTHFSPDSKEQFKNYLKQSDLPVVSTEHLDFYGPAQNREDWILDYEQYSKRIDALNEEYENRLLKGIEVGFTYNDRTRLSKYLDKKFFDIILLSVHHNGKDVFMALNHDTKDLQEHMKEYFDLMLVAVQNAPRANVLAHFDFGLRGYDDVTIEDLYGVEDQLIDIFKLIVQNDQALELNTSSMYKHKNAHLYEYAIELYQSVGGKMFTVGSDAHRAKDYQRGFNAAFSMLEKFNVKELVVFQNQEPQFVPIPKIK
jgi:histidinol-phosphatase (PHP family)